MFIVDMLFSAIDRAEAKDHRAKPVFGAGPAVQEVTARGHEVPPMKGVYRGV